jgi:hypothetical protein
VRPPPRGRSSPAARHSSQAAEDEFAVAATVDAAPPGVESILSREFGNRPKPFKSRITHVLSAQLALGPKISCGPDNFRGTNISLFGFGRNSADGSVGRGGIMSKHSDLWRQAQVCMSLARATDDPVLKERYEDLAVNLVRSAEPERGHGDKTSGAASIKSNPQK